MSTAAGHQGTESRPGGAVHDAPGPNPHRKIYCLVGVEPEVQAYAMAKYSRSSQSMLESVREISAQKAEQFLNTFYFSYGHKSIADLAPIVVALENISILAAIRVVDEPLWNGQERSTRYQNFRQSGFYCPFHQVDQSAERFRQAAARLFTAYEELTPELTALLEETVPRPEQFDEAAYRRTLRARAFDVARQLLPLATRTSLGQLVTARVLERQICRLLADPQPEVREIGGELRAAASQPAETPTVSYPELVRAAPTLVKYTAEAEYERRAHDEVRSWIGNRLEQLGPADRSKTVELADDESVADELCATLLYRVDSYGHSYRQIQGLMRELPPAQKRELVEASLRPRGNHDELLREHQSGYAIKLDLLIDIGSFRDLHRHRRCIQIAQSLSADNSYDSPEWVFKRGLTERAAEQAGRNGVLGRYVAELEAARGELQELESVDAGAAIYLLPLAYRTRALFKLDLAEAAYIAELRSAPAGHFSYREVAWQIYLALRERFPAVAQSLRVHDPSAPFDLLQR